MYQDHGEYAAPGYPNQAAAGSIPSYASPYPPSAPRLHFPGTVTPWSTGLCHCFDDPGNCVITCFCPCITFGQIAEILDKGTISCGGSGAVYGVLLGLTGGLSCLYSCFYRSKMRGQYDLDESPCADCLVHFFCEPCALCQEYRQLKNRGFDMGIGWAANIERMNRGIVTSAPLPAEAMRR